MSINIYKYFLYILILTNYQISSSIIKIPFKIKKANIQSDKSITKEIEDKSFNYKLYSLINLGSPPQKIEASFNLKTSNFYISNYCRNSSTFYSFKDSSTFFKIKTDEKTPELMNNFYCNETFFFNSKKNDEIEVNNMLLYTPEFNNKNNCLNIGLKFPNSINNKFQESFIQQLKHKNIINKYIWTMNLYNNNNSIDNDNYDGEFIFGDILTDFYSEIDKKYSYKKIKSTYTGNSNRNKDKMNMLEWGILFQVFYQLYNGNEKKYIYMNSFVSEFDFGINTIIGTSEYFQNIRNDYFNDYINNKICKISYMRSTYKYIYCDTANFGINDLKKFPTLYFRNKDLKYIFYLNYEDLFYLSSDNKYYIFNIMLTTDYGENNSSGKWIFGLPFWRKYQFSFDIDNKMIYYYNMDTSFIDKKTHNTKNTHMREINDEVENIYNDTYIPNNQRIIDPNSNKKDEEIKIKPYIFIILLIIIFIFLFCFLVFLVKKTLFKKGYILMRNKKASELEEDDSLSSKNINFIKKDNDLIKKEIEMQSK